MRHRTTATVRVKHCKNCCLGLPFIADLFQPPTDESGATGDYLRPLAENIAAAYYAWSFSDTVGMDTAKRKAIVGHRLNPIFYELAGILVESANNFCEEYLKRGH